MPAHNYVVTPKDSFQLWRHDAEPAGYVESHKGPIHMQVHDYDETVRFTFMLVAGDPLVTIVLFKRAEE